jgi:outer membrane autotransporter protein
VRGGDFDSLRLSIGTRWSRDFRGWGGIVWQPELRAFYDREFADSEMRATIAFDKSRDKSIVARSGDWGRNSGRLGVGLNAQLTDNLNFRIDYDYEVYDHTTANELAAMLTIRW